MNKCLRIFILTAALLGVWQGLISLFHLPPYILPSPQNVSKTWLSNAAMISKESLPTIVETIAGLFFGLLFGCITALAMTFFRQVKLWMLPILIISQAIPIFAIAPLLVVWFGYGVASKIATTVLMLFFPIASAFYDGLRRTEPGWLDLASTMQATKWRMFWYIRIPAALPSLASGLRVAVVIAPIGAIVGEWVGASHGLGFLMLNANARMQIDLMFAALFSLIIFSLLLFYFAEKIIRWTIPWQPEN